MGNKPSDHAKLTSSIKRKKISEYFCIKIKRFNETLLYESELTLFQGHLNMNEYEIPISYPTGALKYTKLNPLKNSLKLYLKYDEKWIINHESLNVLIEFRSCLQISMRPKMIETPHQCLKCEKTGIISCFSCGNRWCKSHITRKTDLEFLSYSDFVPVCDSCINAILDVKSEMSKKRYLPAFLLPRSNIDLLVA